MKSKAILLVEDDINLGYVIQDNLSINGYHVHHVEDGEKGWQAFQDSKYELCILDVMLPRKDGFSLAEQIREVNKDIPILFLTAKSMKEDKITGFLKGGDDYITKPFSIEELLLRINVFMKRSQIFAEGNSTTYNIGSTEFDYKNLTVTIGDEVRTLTQKEAEVLRYLISRPNSVIKRSEILENIWGEDDYFLGRSLDVFISRLRKYIKSDHTLEIVNLHGVGFKLKTK
jgi:DNA-binding response OmpR family regulator